MDINTTIIFSYACFHRDVTVGPYEIRKCEIVENVNQELYHVVYFTKAVDSLSFRNIASIHCRYTSATLVDETWELISLFPLGSFNSLTNKTTLVLLNELVTQMIQSICGWTLNNHISALLKTTKMDNFKSFLDSIAAFGRYNETYRYIHLNRFSLSCIETVNPKTKYKMLHTQLYSIIDLLKLLFFRKISATALRAKIPNKTCTKCKIFSFEERFLTLNSVDMHTIFCQAENKVQQLEMLEIFYPYTRESLHEAISYVNSLNMPIKKV